MLWADFEAIFCLQNANGSMVKDNFKDERQLPITPLARKIIGPINQTIQVFRSRDWPVILEDCSAAYSLDVHQQTLDLYRRNPLYPLFRVMTSDALLTDLKSESTERI